MIEFFARPWPWWVVGPLIGLVVPALWFLGGKSFGISSSLRHLCAATVPGRVEFFRYDWRKSGGWNLLFVLGLVLGGIVAGAVLGGAGQTVEVAASTRADLAALGLAPQPGLVPDEIVSWGALATPVGWVTMVLGGFLLGFGARWGGGCTSGHAISGLANLQWPSLVAVVGFFAGGLFVTWVVLPALLGAMGVTGVTGATGATAAMGVAP